MEQNWRPIVPITHTTPSSLKRKPITDPGGKWEADTWLPRGERTKTSPCRISISRAKHPLQCRGHRFSPWSRKIPHDMGLSPCTTTTDRALEPLTCNYSACEFQFLKPAHVEPVLRDKRSHHKKEHQSFSNTPKNKRTNTSQLILWGEHHPDNQNQTKTL